MSCPVLSRIWIYPIKSLDPIGLESVQITPGGSLENDRRWGMVDGAGAWINGKREPKVHRLRASFAIVEGRIEQVTLEVSGFGSETFGLDPGRDRQKLEAWLSEYFQQPVFLRENAETGFPDDRQASGPTIVSESTLKTVSHWFEGLSLDNIRRRFRANLELADVPPFWEDQLFGQKGEYRPFAIGTVQFWGINPCLRCVVPSRDPDTGTAQPQFVPHFSQYRRSHLPPWIIDRSQFDNPYRLSVNTRIPDSEVGKILCQGDPLRL